jgi:hypothetical protein
LWENCLAWVHGKLDIGIFDVIQTVVDSQKQLCDTVYNFKCYASCIVWNRVSCACVRVDYLDWNKEFGQFSLSP